jgi:endonuclease/exonuclease/phosphatase family metal-dependent hydrolase
MILFHDMEIVGTQECLNNQVSDLQEHLPNYDYIGVGSEGGTAGSYSAIFYKTDKFNLLSHGDFWLSETPDIPSIGWDAALNRLCTYGEFEDKTTGFKFFAFNVHMDHVGTMARRCGAELILQKIQEIAPGQPVFLTGDFNADQASEAYQTITTSCLLFDSFLLSPIVHAPNGTNVGWDKNKTSKARIDHVFFTNQFTPLRYGILTDTYWAAPDGTAFHQGEFPEGTVFSSRLPSDHFAVVVDLKYE